MFAVIETHANNSTKKPPYLFNYIRYINKNIELYGFNRVNESLIYFRLITRELNGTYIILNRNNLTDQNYFKVGNPVKILVHGYTDTPNVYYYSNITTEYLKKGDYNVIQVDWSKYADDFYPVVAGNSKGVGRCIALFIVALNETIGVKLDDIHLIGPSIGAHISGFAGKFVKNFTDMSVGRITGKLCF